MLSERLTTMATKCTACDDDIPAGESVAVDLGDGSDYCQNCHDSYMDEDDLV